MSHFNLMYVLFKNFFCFIEQGQNIVDSCTTYAGTTVEILKKISCYSKLIISTDHSKSPYTKFVSNYLFKATVLLQTGYFWLLYRTILKSKVSLKSKIICLHLQRQVRECFNRQICAVTQKWWKGHTIVIKMYLRSTHVEFFLIRDYHPSKKTINT